MKSKHSRNASRETPFYLFSSPPRIITFVGVDLKGWKATQFFFLLSITLVCGTAAVHGQSALDGFDPNANGAVLVVIAQSDGKILLGGDFTTLSPNGGAAVTRNHIARLNADGTLDSAFDPNANSSVQSMALQTDGKVIVGGGFTSIGGQTRTRLARLDPTTGLADSFDANGNVNATYNILAIAVQADGKILVGGAFTGPNSIGGQTRNHIARLDAATGLADSFDPNANSYVGSIVVQADGKILVGGVFNGANSIGGQMRNYIARLDATTGLADSFNPSANNNVQAIAVQADGKVVAGGIFTAMGGQVRNHIARLDATTGVADAFDPNANNIVESLAVQGDGKILVGGSFGVIGGQTRTRIARLDFTTGLADSFDPKANAVVWSLAVQVDGKILAGGYFNGTNSVSGQARNRIVRLESDGSVDQTLNLNTVGGNVLATAVQPDGKILIGGSFSTVLGVPRSEIARLNLDGTLDTGFNPRANGAVYAMAVQADGGILVGGFFNGALAIGGGTRNYIARLSPEGALDPSFNPDANERVVSIVVQADGKILVGGYFSGANSIGGQTRNYIARLDGITGAVDSFDPNANNTIRSIVVQADAKILAAGEFTTIGGQPRNRIARLDPTTGLADSFDPNANDRVVSIAIQADGKILAGGFFLGANSIGGQPRNYIARLDATSGLADSFDPNANSDVRSLAVQADGKILAGGTFNGANSIGGQTRNRIVRLDPASGLADSFDPNADADIYSIAMQADGKILAGGNFTSIGPQPRNLFARLTNDTAAEQDLAVSQTFITWTRGGSSAQFTRVTFECSTDNVNYTPLGNGTIAGNNWTLTGLSLPATQNIYIRARGCYHSGYENGSESIEESVRNAFLRGLAITRTGNDISVTYDAIAGNTYRLERKFEVSDPTWNPIPEVNDQNPVASGRAQVVAPNAVNQARAFYRVSLIP